jgi:hypothetical protein
VDDYVDAGNDSSLDTTSGVTLEAWVKIDKSTGAHQVIIDKARFDENAAWALIYHDTKNAFLFNSYPGGSLSQQESGTIDFLKWYHVAGTSKSGEQKLYINGEEVDSATLTGSLTTSIGDCLIGNGVNRSYYFNGLIDDVRIYNYARTPSQILQDYNAGLSAHFK